MIEHALTDDGTDVKNRDDADGLDQGSPDATVNELGGVCNEDLLHDGETGISDGLEDIGSLDC